jgi:hypothetical protein
VWAVLSDIADIIDHEDLGMMQRFDILSAPGQPSGCMLDERAAAVRSLRDSLRVEASF